MRQRVALVIAVLLLAIAGNASSCEWWECRYSDTDVWCNLIFQGSVHQDMSQYRFAESCTAMRDCPGGGICGVWCQYSGFCMDV